MKKRNLKVLLFCLLLLFAQPSLLADVNKAGDDAYLSYRSRLNNIKEEKNTIQRRVNAAKRKERVAINQLQATQRQLERYQASYLSTQEDIQSLVEELRDVEKQIYEIDLEAEKKAEALRFHLHQLYIKKANILSSFISSLLNLRSITEFLNTLYYQKKIISREMELVNIVKQKYKDLNLRKQALVRQKEALEENKAKSKKLKQVIYKKKQEQRKLVNRLRKERLAYQSAERQLEQESNQLTQEIIKLTKGDNLDLSDLVQNNYAYPCSARVTSPYGYRRHPIFRVRSFHSGIDLGARYGTSVKASNGGVVIYAGWYSGYGKTVIVSHDKKRSTLYAHLSAIKVSVGDKVAQGNVIGKVGSTGYSTGPHLHFEFRANGKTKNPLSVLRR